MSARMKSGILLTRTDSKLENVQRSQNLRSSIWSVSWSSLRSTDTGQKMHLVRWNGHFLSDSRQDGRRPVLPNPAWWIERNNPVVRSRLRISDIHARQRLEAYLYRGSRMSLLARFDYPELAALQSRPRSTWKYVENIQTKVGEKVWCEPAGII